MKIPRLLLAAPASGQGKTTVAVGIMAALSRRGYAVAPAKVGPDYIDPGYHALATGRPGRNLDPWLLGEELILPLLAHGFAAPKPADVAVIEGAMGLFDGRIGTDGVASSAHVARLTRTPVVLVVDISSAARTIAATVHGLRTFDPELSVAGVILNKAGSTRHSGEVRRSIETIGLPVLGVLPRDGGVSAPSRHLGLVPAAERPDAAASLDRLAEQIERYVDLDAVLDVARSAEDLAVQPWSPAQALADAANPSVLSEASVAAAPSDTAGREHRASAGVSRVAIAGGRAFTFRYAETEELLVAAGCDPVPFDPLTDSALPPDISGLYLGGGFPEVHASALAANTTMLTQIRHAIAGGLPTVAECAGLLYLCETVEGAPMVGAIPAAASMNPRLSLGYREARTAVNSLLGPAGTLVHGHEFHRTRTDPMHTDDAAWLLATPHDGTGGFDDAVCFDDAVGFALDPAGTGTPTLHASYLHVHWAGAPRLAARFAAAVHAYSPGVVAGDTPGNVASAPAIPRARRLEHDQQQHHPDGAVDLDHHGDREVGDGLVDLAVNVRLPQPPDWLARVIGDGIAALGSYPDVTAAREALAGRHGVRPEMVLPTSGGAEAFTLIARAVAGRHPLVVHPQFTEPEAALRRAGRLAERHLLSAEDGFLLDATRVSGAADLVLVGNPTNPTGVQHRRDVLHALRHAGRTLVVDEAFGDAVAGEPESMIAAEMDDLLVVRSLTKTWGLAGLRAGYVVGDPALISQLAALQSPWSVSSLAGSVMVATSTAEAIEEAERGALEQQRWREHLVAGLRHLGLQPVDSAAPFVLVRVGDGVRERLRVAGFAVRRCDTFPGLDDTWVRIAARSPDLVEPLLEQLAVMVDQSRIGPWEASA